MTPSGAAGARIGAPIAAQLISLLAAGWIITLLVTIAIVLVLPQPLRPTYPLTEVVRALKGGPLSVHDGRSLVRLSQVAPPPTGQLHLTNGMYRAALAAALHQPLSKIRLERYPISDPVRRMLLTTLQANPPRPVSPPGAFLPPIYGAPIVMAEPAAGGGASRGPSPAPRFDASASDPASGQPIIDIANMPPLVDDFTVAVQEPSGRWTVVKPLPASFPDPWQQRIILWFVACFALLTPIGAASRRANR